MMLDEDRGILEEFATRVRRDCSGARVWAYGSRARGEAGWDSDFDVCVVLDQVTPAIDRRIRDHAWEIGFENDRVITTIVMDEEQFARGPMSESTLVESILREGVQA